MMPGQNGYDLTKEIKKINIPIILLTAKGEVEIEKRIELEQRRLRKPFKP